MPAPKKKPAPAKKAKAPKTSKKIKVEQLAKELGKEAKELLAILKDLGIPAKTKASSIEEESVKIVKELVSSKGKPSVTAQHLVPPEKKESHAVEAQHAAPRVVKETPSVEPVKPSHATAPQTPTQPVAKEIPNEEARLIAPQQTPPPAVKETSTEIPKKIIIVTEDEMTVKDLADKMNVRISDLIKELMIKGILATINQRIALDIVKEVASKMGFEIKKEEKEAQLTASEVIAINADTSKLKPRPPVVTIMGHVDHGKTKLLDAIRKSNVVATEAGGITQHIGAYQVVINNRYITFLDTPGHEAFTALRARGANATDVVVLVVAADDGIMPQTKEAIDHARASNVPIIVAINKIDKPSANQDRVKQQLSEHDLAPEEWGGKTVTVGVSAKEGKGIDTLLEMILLVSDMQELKANPFCAAQGIVIESYMDKSMGPIATVLIKEGTLKVGDSFYSGACSGKVRALINDKGKRIPKAGPATPVKILGFSEVPVSGEIVKVMANEKEARAAAEKNRQAIDPGKSRGKVVSLEDFSKKIKSGEVKVLNLIIKADVHGSQEALVSSLADVTKGNIKTNIIRNSTGSITQSDIMLAKASEAIIVGFNVDFEADAREIAESEGVDARLYNIIYEVIDDIHLAMEGMLEPEYEEVVTGHAEVRQLFKYSKVGVIAGSFVTDGKMTRGSKARVLRDKEKVAESSISTLKRFKDDVKEVASSMECGITVSGFDGIKVGDIVEQFEMRIKRKSVKA